MNREIKNIDEFQKLPLNEMNENVLYNTLRSCRNNEPSVSLKNIATICAKILDDAELDNFIQYLKKIYKIKYDKDYE